ncbi:MAG: transglutaminase-like domain-containing protein [Eubacteriaceae bacterium]|nr:transglutaminase-like domain-containing protein [Eubacteriaceae bacterium]
MRKATLLILAAMLLFSSAWAPGPVATAATGISFNYLDPLFPATVTSQQSTLIITGLDSSLGMYLVKIGDYEKIASLSSNGTLTVNISDLAHGRYPFAIGIEAGQKGFVKSFLPIISIHQDLFIWDGNVAYFSLESDVYYHNLIERSKLRSDRESLDYYLDNPGADESLSQLAEEITEGCTTQYEKAKAIHTYIADKLYYDKSKDAITSVSYFVTEDSYKSMLKSLSEEAVRIYAEKRGVCLGFAALACCLLKSVGIPAIFIAGYTSEEGSELGLESNHAWVEAYVGNRWIVMDPTWDCANTYTDSEIETNGIRSYLNFDPDIKLFSVWHSYNDSISQPVGIELEPIATTIIPSTIGEPKVVIGHVSPTSIKLQFSSTGAISYDYFIYSTDGTLVKEGVSSGSVLIENLECGKQYTIKASAVGKSGSSPKTQGKTVRIRPLRPASARAAIDPLGIKVSWAAVKECDGYAIYRSESKIGEYSLIKIVNSSLETEYLDTDQTSESEECYYKIAALKQVNDIKVPSVFTGSVSP